MPKSRSGRSIAANRCKVIALLAPLCALVSLAGCPMQANNNGSSNNDGASGDEPFLDTASNSTFDSATALSINDSGELKFRGTISNPTDLDIYKLGVLNPGDRVIVDVQRTSGDLDGVAAVFDDQQNAVAYSDDRTPDSSNLNPYIDVIIRAKAGVYFVAITSLEGTDSSGDYDVNITSSRRVGVPNPQPQIIWLDWAGGQGVAVKNVGTFDLPPFNAADLGPYDGRTQAMKDCVRAAVMDRYHGYNLAVLSSDDSAEPGGPHSTIYFGGTNRRAYAISEEIDTLNANPNDDSIIFTGSFRTGFGKTPTFDEMCTAVGNTVSHEVGHLLGLVHTMDCNDLMDTTCGNARLLQAQFFSRAALDSSTFPLGFQDATTLLGWILGFSGI